MTGKVYSCFKVLMAKIEINKSKRIPFDDVKGKKGVATSNIPTQEIDEVQRYNASVIASLYECFGCEVGTLIMYDRSHRRDD
ncbi:MAG: hypothetical protein WAV05_14420 [Anaerolineales bacterium]